MIGIDSKGRLYIVECKSGEINRPSRGLGQLLLYAALISRMENFRGFKDQIENKKSIKICREKLDENERRNLARKIGRDNRMFLFLAVSKEPESRLDLLRELVTYVKPTQLRDVEMKLQCF